MVYEDLPIKNGGSFHGKLLVKKYVKPYFLRHTEVTLWQRRFLCLLDVVFSPAALTGWQQVLHQVMVAEQKNGVLLDKQMSM